MDNVSSAPRESEILEAVADALAGFGSVDAAVERIRNAAAKLKKLEEWADEIDPLGPSDSLGSYELAQETVRNILEGR